MSGRRGWNDTTANRLLKACLCRALHPPSDTRANISIESGLGSSGHVLRTKTARVHTRRRCKAEHFRRLPTLAEPRC